MESLFIQLSDDVLYCIDVLKSQFSDDKFQMINKSQFWKIDPY